MFNKSEMHHTFHNNTSIRKVPCHMRTKDSKVPNRNPKVSPAQKLSEKAQSFKSAKLKWSTVEEGRKKNNCLPEKEEERLLPLLFEGEWKRERMFLVGGARTYSSGLVREISCGARPAPNHLPNHLDMSYCWCAQLLCRKVKGSVTYILLSTGYLFRPRGKPLNLE